MGATGASVVGVVVVGAAVVDGTRVVLGRAGWVVEDRVATVVVVVGLAVVGDVVVVAGTSCAGWAAAGACDLEGSGVS